MFAIGALLLVALGIQPLVARGDSHSAMVDLRLTPANLTVDADTTFDIQIQVEPNGQSVIGVQSFVNYDPRLMQVLDLTLDSSSPLSVPLAVEFDNNLGTINLVAGTFGPAATDTFVLGTISFASLGNSGETDILFSTSGSRETVASSSGEEFSVLCSGRT